MSRTMTISSWSASKVRHEVLRRIFVQPGADLRVHLARRARRASEPVAVGILADRDEDLAHRALDAIDVHRRARVGTAWSGFASVTPHGLPEAGRFARSDRVPGREAGWRSLVPFRDTAASNSSTSAASSVSRSRSADRPGGRARLGASRGWRGPRVRVVDRRRISASIVRRDVLRVLGCVTHVAADEHLLVRTPKRIGPSVSLIPNSVTMRRAISVARSMSSCAPVVGSPNLNSSAVRPPSNIAISSCSSRRERRSRSSVGSTSV